MHINLSTAISMSLHLMLHLARAVLRFCALAFERSAIRLSALDMKVLFAVPRMPLCVLRLFMAVALSYLRKSDICVFTAAIFVCVRSGGPVYQVCFAGLS